MIDSQIYSDYLDGNISDELDKEFVKQFAIDSEFRAGFKSFIKITNCINSNSKNFGVGQNEKDEIFVSLASIYPKAPLATKISVPFWNKPLFRNICVAIASSIITYLLFDFFYRDNEPKYSTIMVLGGSSKTEISKIEGKSNIDKNQKTIIKYVYLKEKNIPKTENNEVLTSIADIPENNQIDSERNLLAEKNNDFSAINKVLSENEKIINTNQVRLQGSNFQRFGSKEIILDNNFLKNSNFRLELINSPSWFYENPKIQPTHENKFNNLGINLTYDLSEKLSIGTSIKFETFNLVYDEKAGNEEYTFYQQPNLTTFGLGLKFYPVKFNDFFSSYLKLDIGANYTGVVTREGIGIEYFIAKNAYFSLGFDLNQYNYKHLNNYYSNGKYSFNYGIGIRL